MTNKNEYQKAFEEVQADASVYRTTMKGNLTALKAFAIKALALSEVAETTDDRAELDELVDDIVAMYTGEAKDACYASALSSENPMHYAINTFFFKSIRVKNVIDKETKMVSRTIEDCDKKIDLLDLHKKVLSMTKNAHGIGTDSNWVFAAEKFNYYLTYRAAMEMGDNRLSEVLKGNDNFIMNKISKEFDLGKNPVSNNQLKRTLQTIVHMMIGEEFQIKACDLAYLNQVYIKDNGKSRTGVMTANHKTLVEYLKKICYRVMNNLDGYEVESREVKKSK